MKNKILSVLLGLSLTVGVSTALAQKALPTKGAPVDAKANQKRTAELTKFNKENAKLAIDHIQKMRAMNIKNLNLQFDRMIAHQKEVQKIGDDALVSGKFVSPERYVAKSEEFKKSQDSAQNKFLAATKYEDEKFQVFMKKRLDDFAKIKK